jgi:hypothetical protein
MNSSKFLMIIVDFFLSWQKISIFSSILPLSTCLIKLLKENHGDARHRWVAGYAVKIQINFLCRLYIKNRKIFRNSNVPGGNVWFYEI